MSTTDNRYTKHFAERARNGDGIFIPFTVLGYPDPETCYQSLKTMIDTGATALEVGIAFSDPVADGPIIQEASFQTLDAGFSVADALALITRVREYDATIPIGILVYYNVVLARGADRFFADAANAGADSILIADLPPHAAEEVLPAAHQSGVAAVFIVSPLTDDTRLEQIAKMSSAYIYVVSRLGITGTESKHDKHLHELLSRIKRFTALPLCVGFGVSSPDDATRMRNIGADGVITGSKVVELVKHDASLKTLRTYLGKMVEAVGTRPVKMR